MPELKLVKRCLLSALWTSVVAVLSCGEAAKNGPSQAVESGVGAVVLEREPRFIPLEGSAIGVIVRNIGALWRIEGRSAPEGAWAFSHDGGSYRWFYVRCPPDSEAADTYVLPVGPDGKQRKPFSAVCLARDATAKQLTLVEPYALVSLEVNDGLGSPPCESFVARNIRRLDGSPAYPLNVTTVVEDAEARFDRTANEQRDQVADALREIGHKAFGDDPLTGPRRQQRDVYVTWMQKLERLRVECRLLTTDGRFEPSGDIAPVEKEPETAETENQAEARAVPEYAPGELIGYEIRYAFEYSKEGKLVERVVLEPASLRRRIELPQ